MSKEIKAILETMFKGYEAALIYFQNEGIDHVKQYFKSLFWLFVISFVPSLPLIYYGIFYNSNWALMMGGLWRAGCTFLLMLAATPIGIIYEIATGGIAGSGQRYTRRVSGVFIAELLFVLIVSLIPVSNNPKMFPVFIVASLLLGFLGAMSMNRQAVLALVGVLMVGIVLSFYFPNTFSAVREGIRRIDVETGRPTPIKHKLDDYKAGRVVFFLPNGEAKVWYIITEEGQIELFDKEGVTNMGVKSEKISRDILRVLKKKNWENLSPNNIIEEKPVAAINPEPPAPPPKAEIEKVVPRGYIPSLDAQVTGLNFFESGINPNDFGQRSYHNNFEKNKTRKVYFELNIRHPQRPTRSEFDIVAKWYYPDGKKKYYRVHSNLDADWTQSNHVAGIGDEKRGELPPGRYRLDLFVAGNEVASGYFNISHEHNTMGYIRSIDARVTSLRFFEGGNGGIPMERRTYSNRFRKYQTRFIYYELNLSHPQRSQREEFEIASVWHFPDGQTIEQTQETCLESNWYNSTHSSGRGFEKRGGLDAGTYQVDLLVDGDTIASGAFEIQYW